ncbi:hypothetical protein PENTCL1PPCAC_14823 [Pristionchus entomophagus]|uniref:Uncharacterized protein n=1 Tax=Pristionchus entomophagus TaxID=358040 RepID=A0AAV5TEJ2_9BILA|nr:hypothetical protein PENTCL1PPCAC_14823 [Pristionchus entomophagus]
MLSATAPRRATLAMRRNPFEQQVFLQDEQDHTLGMHSSTYGVVVPSFGTFFRPKDAECVRSVLVSNPEMRSQRMEPRCERNNRRQSVLRRKSMDFFRTCRTVFRLCKKGYGTAESVVICSPFFPRARTTRCG